MSDTPEGLSNELTLTAKEKALIAVGASIAAGCRPCLERSVELARQAGACERSIRLVVETALEAHGRLVASLAECAEKLQAGKPEVDASFRGERARLVELTGCASALPLRDAQGLRERLAGARAAGCTERMIETALTIARSLAETATSIAEDSKVTTASSAAAASSPACCGDARQDAAADARCSCGCGSAGPQAAPRCG